MLFFVSSSITISQYLSSLTLCLIVRKEERKKSDLHHLGEREGRGSGSLFFSCVRYEMKEEIPKSSLLFGRREKWKEEEKFSSIINN